MPFLHDVRDTVIKDRWLRRENRRDRNAITASGTEVQDGIYV
jgi:hypothetical protein